MNPPDHEHWLERAEDDANCLGDALDGLPPQFAAADLRLHLQLLQNQAPAGAHPTVDWQAIQARTAALSADEDRALRAAAEESAQAQRLAPAAAAKKTAVPLAGKRRTWLRYAAAAAALFAAVAAYQVWLAPRPNTLGYGQSAEVAEISPEMRYILPAGAVATVYAGGRIEVQKNGAGQDQVSQPAGRVAYDFNHAGAAVTSRVGVIAGQNAQVELHLASSDQTASVLTVLKGRVLIVSVNRDGYSLEAGQTAYFAESGAVKIVRNGDPAPRFDLPLPQAEPALVQPFHPADLPDALAPQPTLAEVPQSPPVVDVGNSASAVNVPGSLAQAATAADPAPPVDDLPPSDFMTAKNASDRNQPAIQLPHTPAPAGNHKDGQGNSKGQNGNNANGAGNGRGSGGNTGLHLGAGNGCGSSGSDGGANGNGKGKGK